MFNSVHDNVNEHLPCVTHLLNRHGVKLHSRNGGVAMLPQPLVVTTERPHLRTLLCKERQTNPFVDFFDALYILAGTRSYGFLVRIHKRFEEYTEYNTKPHGAYNHRIFSHFGFNQLYHVAERLVNDPFDRRVVIQLWDAAIDNRPTLQDVPCNIAVLPAIRDGNLDLTVYNRSNDVYWGMLGVNIVQFSMLQEVLAYLIGCPIGRLYQISNNAHAYTEFGPYKRLSNTTWECEKPSDNYYVMIVPDLTSPFSERIKIMNAYLRIITRCFEREDFTEAGNSDFVFLREVVYPMSACAISKYYSPKTIADPNWRRAVEIYREH